MCSVSCAVLAAVAACADVRPGQPASQEERAAAGALVTQLAAIAGQPLDAESILHAASFTPIATLLASPDARVALPSPGDVQDIDLGSCVIATATSVTWTECTIADHVVDGTWSARRNRIHAALVDVFVRGAG